MCRWSLSNDVHVISSLEALGMILSAVGSLMTCQVGKAGKGGNVFQLAPLSPSASPDRINMSVSHGR